MRQLETCSIGSGPSQTDPIFANSEIMKQALTLLFTMSVILTFTLDSEARKRRRGGFNKPKVSRTKYPSKAHNQNFLNSCTTSLPTVYNPSINNRMEGGGKNRMGEKVNSIEEAAQNGRPVTVAMDRFGDFGSKCNWKNSSGTATRRCLLLVHLPGLDNKYPGYGKKFPNLPVDSFIAIVEDTGGAFSHKGTGKIDIPFSRHNYHRASPFKSVNFEVLEAGITDGKQVRQKNFTHLNPFVGGRNAKCSWDASRRAKAAPVAGQTRPGGAT